MNWKRPDIQKLIDAVLVLRTPAEARHFLRDLMTESEIEEFAKRLRAAELLSQKVPYTKIVEETGLSSTTVARVARWLKSEGGGYRRILHRLSSEA